MEDKEIQSMYSRIVEFLLKAEHEEDAGIDARNAISHAITTGVFMPLSEAGEYYAGMAPGLIERRLQEGGVLERIVAYGARAVQEEVAAKRLPKASMVEKALIATYHRDVYETHARTLSVKIDPTLIEMSRQDGQWRYKNQ